MEVSEKGDLANWMVPGKMIKGMGGAMDLVAGVKKIIVVMEHVSKNGEPKFIPECTLPLTGKNVVDMIITDLAVFQRAGSRSPFRLIELAPGVTREEVREKTSAHYGMISGRPERADRYAAECSHRQPQLFELVAAPVGADETLRMSVRRRIVTFAGLNNYDSFRAFASNGSVPCLIDGERTVWDSLASSCYLGDRHPG